MKLKLKFKAQMLVPILSAVIIGTTVLQFISYKQAVRVTEGEIFSGIERSAEMAANQIDAWIVNELSDVHSWAENHLYGDALLNVTGALA